MHQKTEEELEWDPQGRKAAKAKSALAFLTSGSQLAHLGRSLFTYLPFPSLTNSRKT